MDAMLEPGTRLHEDHPRAGQLALIPQHTLWNPDVWQGAGPLQAIEPLGIQLVGFIHHPPHQLCLMGMHQLRDPPSGLKFVHHPVPVADCLHGACRALLPIIDPKSWTIA